MDRYAFKVYYHGTQYSGFQRQPNGMGIENFLEFAFINAGYIYSFSKNKYSSISRTDSGVSAIGNIFSLIVNQKPNILVINSFLPSDQSIIVWNYAKIDKISILQNPIKHYDYLLINPSSQIKTHLSRINQFIGKHDYSIFIKKKGSGKNNPNCTINKIEIKIFDNDVLISIFGNRFGREQIRRMIGFLTDLKHLNKNPNDFLDNQNEDIQIKSEKAEYLVLVDIFYDHKVNWIFTNSKLKYILKRKLNQLKIRQKLIEFEKRNIDLLYSNFLT